MARDKDNWRLAGQERYLQGAALIWKPYRGRSETWEHHHCDFCWAKFMDPATSEAHRTFVKEHAEVLTEGHATTAEHEQGAEYHWICEQCFNDFADRFEWRVA